MDPDDGAEDEGPFTAWLPRDDRLWRHPSEFEISGPHDLDLDGRNPPSGGSLATLVRTPARTWTVAVVAGVVGALLASGVSVAAGGFSARTTVMETVTRVAMPDNVSLAAHSTGRAPDWPWVADAITASMVAVVASDGSSGSGVIYATAADRSYILTSSELVGGRIAVTLNDGDTRLARLVRTDPKSGLALVSIPGMERAVPAFGSVGELEVAEPLLAVGAGTTSGSAPAPLSVQSVDEAVAASDDQTMVGMLAVTGSSPTVQGGALVDPSGDVVGITTALTSYDVAQQNTSYAIPIDCALRIARQMLLGRAVTHPYLGMVDAVDLSPVTASQHGLRGGALVESIVAGSPAASAGITADDVVTSLGGQAVSSAGALVAMLGLCRPGAWVSVSYLHQGKAATATIHVIEQPTGIVDPDGD